MTQYLVLFDVDGTLLLTHDELYVEASRASSHAGERMRGRQAGRSPSATPRSTSKPRTPPADWWLQ